MTIQRGDFVRPKKPSMSLPQDSVWRVVCSYGALKLEPENDRAKRVSRCVQLDCRYPAQDFDKVVLFRGEWTTADVAFSSMSTRIDFDPQSEFVLRPTKARPDPVATATIAAEQAANATAAIDSLLEAARKLEAERQDELRIAKAAKAKADKEAAAKAKVEEAKRQLSARLDADRCLGEATLALIGEVSRLHFGGPEQVAHSSIANHVDQLQALAKSYGYRIAKPSLLAQVVKL